MDIQNMEDPWGTAYTYHNFDLIPPGAKRKDRNTKILIMVNGKFYLQRKY